MDKKTIKEVLDKAYKNYQKRQFPTYSERFLFDFNKTANSANSLTTIICDFLKWNEHHANRINTMGVPMVGKKLVNPITGKATQKVTFRPTTTKIGTADIKALIKRSNDTFAISVDIEVKWGKDRQSEHQKKYEAEINKAGGVYIIVHTLEEFIEWYFDFMGIEKPA